MESNCRAHAAAMERRLDKKEVRTSGLKRLQRHKGQSEHTARATLHALAGPLLVLLVIPIAGCETSDGRYWCLEEQDEKAVRATGQLLLSYNGLFGPAPSSSFSTFVFTSHPRGIVLQGCNLDNNGALWRFWSAWAVGESPSFPVEVQSRDTDLPSYLEDTIPNFDAALAVCTEEGDCPTNMWTIFHAWHGMSGFSEGSGVVEALDADVGRFMGQMTVTNSREETIVVTADVSWPPSAFTFPDAGGGGTGGAGGMSDAGMGGSDGGP